MADEDDKPLKVEEVFSKLNDGIWSELKATGTINVSLIRRNLQRDFVGRLIGMVVSGSGRASSFPYAVVISPSRSTSHESRALSRMHLNDLHKRLEAALSNAVMDDSTRAHFQETHAAIGRALDSIMIDG